MTTNNVDLYLTWFFKGGFFKRVIKEVESELTGLKCDKHFINFFFSGSDNVAQEFINKFDNKTKKNEKKYDKNRRLMSLPEMEILNEILTGNFSDGDTAIRRSHIWDIAMGLHSNETLKTIKNFLHDQYSNFRDSESCRKFISSLGIGVCPYCDKGIIDCTPSFFYGDLDHKKDKAGKNFYLSLNIHNLSPCCKVCNQHKGIAVLQFDPEKHQLDDLFKFTLSKKSIAGLSAKYCPSDIEIEITPIKAKPGYTEIYTELDEAVKLSDRYKNMHSVAEYLYQLKRVLNPVWIETLNDLLGKNYTKVDIEKFILADFSWNGTAKIQPLTKLIRDLADEIKLFK